MSCFTIDFTFYAVLLCLQITGVSQLEMIATHKKQIIGARRKMSRCPGGRARQPLE